MRLIFATLTILLCSACASQPAQVPAPVPALSLAPLFADYWEAELAMNPLLATYVGDHRYDGELPNLLGPEQRAREAAFDARWLVRVQAIDPGAVGDADRLSLDILRRSLERSIEARRYPDHLLPINQFYNLASQLAQLGSGTSAQPFKTVQDYERWAQRAARIPALFDQVIANLREGLAAGVVQPDVLMVKSLAQIEALATERPQDSLFWQPIAAFPDSIGADDRQRLSLHYEQLIGTQLLPAYRRLADYLSRDYLPRARRSVGLDALPDGAAWYASKVRAITTTDLDPAAIHDIGLAEVARIHDEIRTVMHEVGFEGDLGAFFRFMSEDPRFTYADEAAALKAYRDLGAVVDTGAGALFALRPKAGFEIRPVEAFRAQSAAGGSYQRPSEDGSRPGVFYLNTYDLPSRKTWAAESLFLHEAIPGHHFQLGIQQELPDLPAFRRFGSFTAYVEGWGLYAESLGRELGVYRDPYQYFGRLQAELFRALRLVVDTGLHAKGWSRQQVIDYLLANSAIGMTQAVAETERYIAIPGQALAYKIGELRILALRRRAETALGARFDLKAFHGEVLGNGAVPLDVLETRIDRWIAAQRR